MRRGCGYTLAAWITGFASGAVVGMVLSGHVTLAFLLGGLVGLSLGAYLRWLGDL